MLTPQEVSGRSFTKAVMGGYNMSMVDEFLDELTADYTTLFKENATLKAKMKVLVDKVEEYRATEDSMRATLLTAQRMADSIVKEAEEKRNNILQQAENAARERLDEFRKEAEGYQKRLQQGQEEIRRFVAESRTLCEKELQFLDEFPDQPLIEEIPLTVEEIEGNIMSTAEAEAVPPAPAAAEPAPVPTAAAPVQEVSVPPRMAVPSPAAGMPTAESLLDSLVAKTAEPAPAEDLTATRRVNISELKFGPNYRSGAD